MKVLFIHEVSYREKVIFEMHEFPELFSILGDDVTFFEFPENINHPKASFRTKTTTLAGRVYPEANVKLVTPPYFGLGLLDRLLAPVIDFPALWKLIKFGNFDRIILYSVPTTGWQTIFIAKRFNVPVVFRALDVSHKIRRSIFWRLILSAEKYIYKNATLLSGNNPAMVRYCESVSNRNSISRVNVPPLDLEHFAKSSNVDFRKLYQIPQEAKVILYMGTFFSFSGLDEVIEEFSSLLENDPNTYLMLIGGGELDKPLKHLVADLHLDSNVIFTGFIDFADLPTALKAGDVAINAFKPELLTHVALPNKILQYMAAGIPVVSTSLEGIREILGENSGVTWVNGPKGLMKTAIELSKLPSSELRTIINSQKETVNLKFNKSMALEGFRSTVENLT